MDHRNKRALVGRVYFSMQEVADAMGEDVRKVRRWLRREGAIVKRGRWWYTTKDLLRGAFPEAYDTVIAGLPE